MSDFENVFFDRLADALLRRGNAQSLQEVASAAYWAKAGGSAVSLASFASAMAARVAERIQDSAAEVASPSSFASPVSAAVAAEMADFASAVAARVAERLQAGAADASPVPVGSPVSAALVAEMADVASAVAARVAERLQGGGGGASGGSALSISAMTSSALPVRRDLP